VGAIWQQFLTFGLLLFLVPWARMRGRKKWLVFLVSAGVAGMFTEVFIFPHYTAPFTCALLILIVAALRTFWYRLARTKSVRLRGLVAGLAMLLLFPLLAMDYAGEVQLPRETPRSRFMKHLESTGGRHLVFVDYEEGWLAWEPNGEWVYNGADLNASRILFAHLRSDAENRQLMDENKDRTAWKVHVGPGLTEVHFEPYVIPPEVSSQRALSAPLPQSTPPLRAETAP
jgi:hypothetical protein